MKRLLVPLILLLLGLGGGVGAGLALAPPAEDAEAAALATELADPCGAVPGHEPAVEGEAAPAEGHGTAEAAPGDHGEVAAAEAAAGERGDAAAGHEYVKLPNQFVVPLLDQGEVSALVLMSLSVEVAAGGQEAVLLIEPKLRDVFLQVLFDHANTGGFDGLFTAASAMRSLRATLLDAATRVAGDVVTDVLIVELVRQDQ